MPGSRLLGAARRAFPAFEEEPLGGWSLRHDPDLPNRRVNACWAIGGGSADHLDEVVRWYAERDRRPIVLTEPGSPVDEALSGWEVQATTDVMTASLSPAEPSLLEPVAEWSTAWAGLRGVTDPHRAALVDRLERVEAIGAVVRRHTTPVAAGLGVRDGDLVGIFNVATSPADRRRGHATRITRSLMAWGAAHGATTAYLQVETANPGAAALYHALGFTTACRYHYRIGWGNGSSQGDPHSATGVAASP